MMLLQKLHSDIFLSYYALMVFRVDFGTNQDRLRLFFRQATSTIHTLVYLILICSILPDSIKNNQKWKALARICSKHEMIPGLGLWFYPNHLGLRYSQSWAFQALWVSCNGNRFRPGQCLGRSNLPRSVGIWIGVCTSVIHVSSGGRRFGHQASLPDVRKRWCRAVN